jgi:hypothetical protein
MKTSLPAWDALPTPRRCNGNKHNYMKKEALRAPLFSFYLLFEYILNNQGVKCFNISVLFINFAK